MAKLLPDIDNNSNETTAAPRTGPVPIHTANSPLQCRPVIHHAVAFHSSACYRPLHRLICVSFYYRFYYPFILHRLLSGSYPCIGLLPPATPAPVFANIYTLQKHPSAPLPPLALPPLPHVTAWEGGESKVERGRKGPHRTSLRRNSCDTVIATLPQGDSGLQTPTSTPRLTPP